MDQRPEKLPEAAIAEALKQLPEWKLISGKLHRELKFADFVGAFPSVVLAAGDYTAIAKHNSALYERSFTVEPGLNRDIEVLRQAK